MRRWARVVVTQRLALLTVVGVLAGASVALAGGSGAALGTKYYACVTPVYKTINLTTAGRSAPRAIRMPTSRVRWLSAYEITP